MNNNKKNTSIAKVNLSTPTSLSIINSMEDFEKIVNYVASSKTYNAGFMINVDQEDGTKKREVDRDAIATCLMLGSELGFRPMQSVMLNKRLDPISIIKVLKGADLGVSPINSLTNIHVWGEGAKEIVYISIHVVNKCLIDANIRQNILEDASKPYYYYIESKSKEEVSLDTDIHVVINTGIKPTELGIALSSGRTAVERRVSRRALVELVRTHANGDVQRMAIPFTLVQATDAGLYKGIDSEGMIVKGKPNWNAHPAAHLIKQSIMLSARIIAADKLNGIYLAQEIDTIIEAPTVEGSAEVIE